jgi:hypothetical protein
MRRIEELKEELDRLEARRELVALEQTTAEERLAGLREQLLDGEIESDDVVAEQLRVRALEETAAEIGRRMAAAKCEIADLEAAQAREEKILRLLELLAAGTSRWARADDLRRELAEHFDRVTAEIAELFAETEERRAGFLVLARSLAPHFVHSGGGDPPATDRKKAVALAKELMERGAELDIISTPIGRWGVPQRTVVCGRKRFTDVGDAGPIIDEAVRVAEQRRLVQREAEGPRQRAAVGQPQQAVPAL